MPALNRTNALRGVAVGVCLAGAALIASCDNFLDPKPNDVLAPENFYKSSSDAVAAVNGVYEATKWNHFLSFWYMTDVASDDIWASPNFGSDGHRFDEYTFNASEGTLAGPWGGSYSAINRANAVIDHVPGITMDATLKARVLGEARYLRALAYFELVRFYGDVPLIEHEVKSLSGLNVSRTPQPQVYALIISDLQAAIPALPASYSGDDLGRVTSGAARTLLGKVYLNQKSYTAASTTLAPLITSGRYQLNAVWKDNFTIGKELTNPESIWEINYDGVADPGAGSVMNLFSLPSAYPGGDAYGLMGVTQSLVNLYPAGDQRGNHGTFMLRPYTDKLNRTVNWSVPNGAAFDKYLDENSTQNMTARAWAAQSNNWIISRFADVLLMYAEAVNEGGTPGTMSAVTALDSVRHRAGLPSVGVTAQAALRDSIRTERRREFVFEGNRWFDLQRWGTLDAAIRAKQAERGYAVIGVPSIYYPIPQSELDINPNLTQNPGWK
ncbi:MAG TPA: RagB/SusD family nutrient uptake outer membrane protein [Gemmatimonadaceae bacterium]|nr:RagB/SusD family nutrient uptake outer membrane protein [Gemmatimonadaceae bacterium]